MKIIRAEERPLDKNSWREAWHEYYPGHTQWGQLTGFNLDIVEPGKGFGMHPHHDMEIVTIPIQGTQLHEDTLGNRKRLSENEVQVMSAGSGIMHSEMNVSEKEPFSSYQVWIYPNQKGLAPSYQQQSFSPEPDAWQLLVSPDGQNNSLRINQKAWFYEYRSSISTRANCPVAPDNCKLYLHMVSGESTLNGETLTTHDSVELRTGEWDSLHVSKGCRLLLIASV